MLTQTLETLRQKRNATETDLAAYQAELASLEASLAITPKYVTGSTMSTPDPQVEGLRTLIVEAQSELSTLQQVYEDDSPFIKKQQEKIASLKKQLATSSKTTKDIPNSSSSSLNTIYLDLQSKVAANKARIKSIAVSISRTASRSSARTGDKELRNPAKEIGVRRGIPKEHQVQDRTFARKGWQDQPDYGTC
jgi:chromosome segregation ATPase